MILGSSNALARCLCSCTRAFYRHFAWMTGVLRSCRTTSGSLPVASVSPSAVGAQSDAPHTHWFTGSSNASTEGLESSD